MIQTPIKWVGGKQRVAQEIVNLFPQFEGDYYEPALKQCRPMNGHSQRGKNHLWNAEHWRPLIGYCRYYHGRGNTSQLVDDLKNALGIPQFKNE